jgi:hypothetical protein
VSRVDTGCRYNWEMEEWDRTAPPRCDMIETAGEEDGEDDKCTRPTLYEQLLIGWFMDAEGTTTMTW